MKKLFSSLLLVSLIHVAYTPAYGAPDAKQPDAKKQAASLYSRLGGYDAIAAVTDDFLYRLATDPQINRFFKGASSDSQRRIRQHVVELLCNTTGGPCVYTGRDLKTAHAGLGITEDDWTVAMKHLTATLDKLKVPAREKAEVLYAITSMKGTIVVK